MAHSEKCFGLSPDISCHHGFPTFLWAQPAEAIENVNYHHITSRIKILVWLLFQEPIAIQQSTPKCSVLKPAVSVQMVTGSSSPGLACIHTCGSSPEAIHAIYQHMLIPQSTHSRVLCLARSLVWTWPYGRRPLGNPREDFFHGGRSAR